MSQRSREELEADGVLLDGHIVPEWFKAQSDGGSIPTRFGRWILREPAGRPAAFIHDFDYYLAALEYAPRTPEWVGARHEGDWRLKQNLALIVSRKRWYARFIGRLWYRGVRVGGKYAMRDLDELAVPPTEDDVIDLHNFIKAECLEDSEQALDTLEKWIRAYD